MRKLIRIAVPAVVAAIVSAACAEPNAPATTGASVAANTSAAAPLLSEKQSINIAAPVEKVWSVLGNFSDVTWVPAVKASTATRGNEIGSVRTIDFGGAKLTEALEKYDAVRHTYSYREEDSDSNRQALPMRDLGGTVTAEPAADGGTLVTWEIRFHRLDSSERPAATADDATARKQAVGTLAIGLPGLKARVLGQ